MKVMINKNDTGKLIKYAREKNGLSIEEVVNELNDKRYIFIEKGRKVPDILQLLKLSNLFKVKMVDMISYRIED